MVQICNTQCAEVDCDVIFITPYHNAYLLVFIFCDLPENVSLIWRRHNYQSSLQMSTHTRHSTFVDNNDVL